MVGRNMTKKEGRISMIFPSFCVPICMPKRTPKSCFRLFSGCDSMRPSAAVCGGAMLYIYCVCAILLPTVCDGMRPCALDSCARIDKAKTREITRLAGIFVPIYMPKSTAASAWALTSSSAWT